MNMMQTVIAQFRQPHGFPGQVAGYIMANRPSNIERNHWTLELLEIQPDDIFLEIGFGPGIAIRKASEIIDSGLIVGVDHSQTMLDQASRRNAAAIKDGKIKLLLGSLDALHSYEESFDKVCSANVVQFWSDPKDYFWKLRRLMKYGGKIATTYLPRIKGTTIQDSRNKANELIDCMWDTNYKNTLVSGKIEPNPS